MFPSDDQQNPYSSTYDQGVPAQPHVRSRGEIIPTQVEAGDVISYAWQQFKLYWGPLVGALFVTMIISYGLQAVCTLILVVVEDGPNLQQQPANPNPFGQNAIAFTPLGIGFNLMQQAVSIFLGIGMTRMSLDAARDKTPGLEQLFSGGRWFWPIVGFSILYGLGLIVGFLLLIIPGIILILMWWPARMLLIDDQAGVMDSFGVARQITKGNWGTTFILGLASFGITILGFLALCIGIIFAIPFVGVIWASGYLMMSGQIGRLDGQAEPTDYGFDGGFQS
jgi:hypothetical protein